MANQAPLWTSVSLFEKGEKAPPVTLLPVLKQDYDIYDFSRMSLACLQTKHTQEKTSKMFSSHHLWLVLEAEANAFVIKCFLGIPKGPNVTGGATHSGDPFRFPKLASDALKVMWKTQGCEHI